jgi:hypothetical protein
LGNILPEQTIVPFVLGPFPRGVGVCEGYLSTPLCNLCEVCKLRAVVYSNGFEDLAEAVAVFITKSLHGCHNITAAFARNADSEIVLGLLLDERENSGFLTRTQTNDGVALPVSFFLALGCNLWPQLNAVAKNALIGAVLTLVSLSFQDFGQL